MPLTIKLLPYIGLGIGLIIFLGLFFQLNRTMEKLRSRIARFETEIQKSADLSARVSGLNLRIEELESTVGAAGQLQPGKSINLNGTVRSKVLKMHRLGQQTERIADTLRVPRGEVDLLVKVHQIVMRPYEQNSSGVTEPEAS